MFHSILKILLILFLMSSAFGKSEVCINMACSFSGRDKVELDVKILELEILMRKEYVGYAKTSFEQIDCVIEKESYIRKIQQITPLFISVSKNCENLDANKTEAGLLTCMRLSLEASSKGKMLIGSRPKGNCGNLISNINITDDTFTYLEELRLNAKENYVRLLKNKMNSSISKSLKELERKWDKTLCESSVRGYYGEFIIGSMKSEMSFMYGNLYSLKNEMKYLKHLNKKAKLTSRLCEIKDFEYTQKIENSLRELVFKYETKSADEMSKKACKRLKRLSLRIEEVKKLCAKRVDTPSYLKSIDYYLHNLSQRVGKKVGDLK